MNRLLVIEDDRNVAEYLKRGLSESGYAVDVAREGVEGRCLACEGTTSSCCST